MNRWVFDLSGGPQPRIHKSASARLTLLACDSIRLTLVACGGVRFTRVVGVGGQPAVPGAIEEVDGEPDGQPDDEPDPRHAWQVQCEVERGQNRPVSYTHLRAHETVLDLVCRLLLE